MKISDHIFFDHKIGELCHISAPMTHFRLEPEVAGKLWLTPNSNRIPKAETEKGRNFNPSATYFRFNVRRNEQKDPHLTQNSRLSDEKIRN